MLLFSEEIQTTTTKFNLTLWKYVECGIILCYVSVEQFLFLFHLMSQTLETIPIFNFNKQKHKRQQNPTQIKNVKYNSIFQIYLFFTLTKYRNKHQ